MDMECGRAESPVAAFSPGQRPGFRQVRVPFALKGQKPYRLHVLWHGLFSSAVLLPFQGEQPSYNGLTQGDALG